METGNLMGRLTRSVRNNKRGYSLFLLLAMVVSVIGGALPTIDGLAAEKGPKSSLDLGEGPGTITLKSVSGEQLPSWHDGKGTSKASLLADVESEDTDKEDDIVEEDLDLELDIAKRILGGAEFNIRSVDELVKEEDANNIKELMVTDTNGRLTLTGLPVGLYEVKETKPPVGYEILEDDALVIKITNAQPHAHLIFHNKELQVSPSIYKEWTEGTEPVDYKIGYQYFGVDGNLVTKSDVAFDTDSINIGNVFYFTPDGDVNKIDITDHKVDVKNHKQYEYDLVENVHDVTFVGDQIKRDIVVKKDFDGLMADNVDVELVVLEEDVKVEDSTNVVGKITLNEKNNWTHTFQDMPRYTDAQLAGSIEDRKGEHIEYGVREVDFETSADGYAPVVQGNEIDSFVIVNKQLEDIDVVIEKVWVGTKGNKSEFQVKVNGEVWETVSMTSKDEWTKTVPLELVPYDAEITVEEINADENYDVNVVEKDNNEFVVEGVERLGSLEILMNKGVRNPKVSIVNVDRKGINTFSMLSAEEDVTEEDVTEEDVTEEDVTEEDVTEEDVTEEDVTEEDVTEDDVAEDDVTEEDVTEDDVTEEDVTVESTRLSGAKFLVESKAKDEEENSVYEKEVTTNQDGLAVIADIPYGEYTITEIESPEGYEFGDVKSIDFIVNQNQTRSKYRADFYNERAKVEAQNIDITVTKDWEFEKDVSGFKIPDDVEMKLVSKLPNGEVHEESEIFKLNKGNDWTKEFTDMLNVNNENEYKELEFTVVEINESDVEYQLHIVKTGSYYNNEGNKVEIQATNVEALGRIDAIKVEGTEVPTTDFELDNNIKAIDGARFELREKDSNKLIRESSTTKDGKFSMVNLPFGDYTLTEIEAPEGYFVGETDSIDITVDEPQTRAVVNVKFENEFVDENSVEFEIKVNWKDSEGEDLDLELVEEEEFKFELFRNDIEQRKYVTLNAENDWTASFENLRKFIVETEEEYEYTVEEAGSSLTTGFETELKGNAKDGYVFVVTQIKESQADLIDVPVIKEWVGDSKKLDEVVLQLMDGEKVVDELKLTSETNWSGIFEDVSPVIEYTLVELDNEGYTSSVYGHSNESGFVVRNTQKQADENENPIEPEETRDIDVELSWESKEESPFEISIDLIVNREVIDTKILNKDADFKYTFKDLKVIDSSDEKGMIEYTVGGLFIPGNGFEVDVRGDMVEGFKITVTDRDSDIDKPSDEDKPTDVDKPTDEDKPTDVDKPTDEDKPADVDKSTDVEKELTLKEVYDMIDGCMSYEDVNKLVGRDGIEEKIDNPKFDAKKTETKIYTWYFGDDYLQVGFSKNLAVVKLMNVDGIETIDSKLVCNTDKPAAPQGGTPQGGAAQGGAAQGGAAAPASTAGGFQQTATSAIGLGLFAMAGLVGVGAIAHKNKEEDED